MYLFLGLHNDRHFRDIKMVLCVKFLASGHLMFGLMTLCSGTTDTKFSAWNFWNVFKNNDFNNVKMNLSILDWINTWIFFHSLLHYCPEIFDFFINFSSLVIPDTAKIWFGEPELDSNVTTLNTYIYEHVPQRSIPEKSLASIFVSFSKNWHFM